MREPVRDYAKIGIVHRMAYPRVVEGEASFLDKLREISEHDCFPAAGVIFGSDGGVDKSSHNRVKG